MRLVLAAATVTDPRAHVEGLEGLVAFVHYLRHRDVIRLVRALRDPHTATWSARVALRWAVVRRASGEQRRQVQEALWRSGAEVGVTGDDFWRLVTLLD